MTGENIEVRLAGSEDMEEAAGVFRSVAGEKVYLETEEPAPDTAQVWRERWSDNGRETLFAVALSGGRIIGGIVLTRYGRTGKTMHVRELGMYVLREYRSAGTGRKLMDYALEWARFREEIKRITLGVYSTNIRAISLYLRYGFHIEGCLRDMALIGGEYADELRMGLDLNR